MVDIFPSLSYFLGRFWSSSVCTLCLPTYWVQCLPGWLSSSSSSSVCCQRSFWWSFASPEAPIQDRYTSPSLFLFEFFLSTISIRFSVVPPDFPTLLFFFHLTPCPRRDVTQSQSIRRYLMLYSYVKQDLGPVWAEKCLWVAGLHKNWFTWKSDSFYYLSRHTWSGHSVKFFFEPSITSLPLVYPYQPNLTLFYLLRPYIFFLYPVTSPASVFFTSSSLSWITPLTFFPNRNLALF